MIIFQEEKKKDLQKEARSFKFTLGRTIIQKSTAKKENNCFSRTFSKKRHKMNKLEYIKESSTGIETVSYENVNISYPEHTHIGHIVMGIVTDGIVEIKIGQQIFA